MARPPGTPGGCPAGCCPVYMVKRRRQKGSGWSAPPGALARQGAGASAPGFLRHWARKRGGTAGWPCRDRRPARRAGRQGRGSQAKGKGKSRQLLHDADSLQFPAAILPRLNAAGQPHGSEDLTLSWGRLHCLSTGRAVRPGRGYSGFPCSVNWRFHVPGASPGASSKRNDHGVLCSDGSPLAISTTSPVKTKPLPCGAMFLSFASVAVSPIPSIPMKYPFLLSRTSPIMSLSLGAICSLRL